MRLFLSLLVVIALFTYALGAFVDTLLVNATGR